MLFDVDVVMIMVVLLHTVNKVVHFLMLWLLLLFLILFRLRSLFEK